MLNWLQKCCGIVITPKILLKVLKDHGFNFEGCRGSHCKFSKPGSQILSIPIHRNKPIPRGTLQQIINRAGLSLFDFQ